MSIEADCWRDESFNGTRVECFSDWVRVTVPGCQPFIAMAEDNPEYRARARALGFSDPQTGAIQPEQMNFEHDRAHAWLAKRLGLPVSPVLHHRAAPVPEQVEGEAFGSNLEYVRDAEEQFVLAFHRYKNALIYAGMWKGKP